LAKRLPCAIQIPMLKKRFDNLNPETGVDVIDWKSACGSKETFEETLQDLKFEYPEYRWEKTDIQREDQYSKMAISDLNKQAKEFNGECLPKREISLLRRKAEPRKPIPRGTCIKRKLVKPKPYKRCIVWRAK
jgi:hypothetical protein